MKKMWVSALLAAAMMTAAGAGGRAERVGAVIGRCGARGRPRALAGGQRVRNADHP